MDVLRFFCVSPEITGTFQNDANEKNMVNLFSFHYILLFRMTGKCQNLRIASGRLRQPEFHFSCWWLVVLSSLLFGVCFYVLQIINNAQLNKLKKNDEIVERNFAENGQNECSTDAIIFGVHFCLWHFMGRVSDKHMFYIAFSFSWGTLER